MKINNHPYFGYFSAVLSAICNATIGIFSVKAISAGLPFSAIAFYRCLLAFIIITSWFILSGKLNQWLLYLKKFYIKIAVCSFFGFYILYTFETNAYNYTSVPVVVFLLLGSAILTTFILSTILHKNRLRIYEIMSCLLAICGLGMILGINNIHELKINSIGVMLAIIAGIGHGGFLAFSHKFRIGSGLIVVNSLALFGIIYLFPAYMHTNFILPNITSLPFLLALVFIPTICGFWLITKALMVIKSSTVSLIELSEPLFAIVFAYIILNQKLNFAQFAGGILITGAVLLNYLGQNYNNFRKNYK
ncbi:MAG: EamA/RhaT family transporter [Burkholderiales bacterium]|nr:EamA/RhaT family transporter [Burkholderiales bacterium]